MQQIHCASYMHAYAPHVAAFGSYGEEVHRVAGHAGITPAHTAAKSGVVWSCLTVIICPFPALINLLRKSLPGELRFAPQASRRADYRKLNLHTCSGIKSS